MDFQVKTFAELDSTQDEAMRLIRQNPDKAQEGTVIHAMSMASGRGRHGNQWHAPMGNLYLSVLLTPEIDDKDCGQLAFVAALAVAETIESLAGTQQGDKSDPSQKIELKWPNDVLVGGKKISGILIEKESIGSKSVYIMGVGINILAPPDGAISLQDICTKRTPINPVRDFFLDVFEAYYLRWSYEGFAPIHSRWMRQAAFLDQEIDVRLANQTKRGIFKGIDKDGALLLQNPQDAAEERYLSGEIFLSPNSSS